MGQKLLKDIKAVGFDVDGTLYKSTVEMSEWIGRAIIVQGAKRMGREQTDFEEEFLTRKETLRGSTSTLNAMGLNGEEIFAWIWDNIPLSQFVKKDEKLRDMLLELREKYRLYLLTNGSREKVLPKLEIMGVDPSWFELKVYCYDEGWVKPEPAPFLFVVETMGLDPEEVAYVGDRVDVDVEAASAIGMRTILVGGESELATVSCPTIYDVAKILR